MLDQNFEHLHWSHVIVTRVDVSTMLDQNFEHLQVIINTTLCDVQSVV